jgi:hypothetical protein
LRATPDNQVVDFPLSHQVSRVFDRRLWRDTENVRIHHIRYGHRWPRELNVEKHWLLTELQEPSLSPSARSPQ